MTVLVVPVMETTQAAEVVGGGGGGCSSLVVLSDGWSVVAEGDNGSFSSITELMDDVSLSKDIGLFEVTVGDVSCGIVKADDACLDVIGERSPPDSRRMFGSEEGSTHALLRGVRRSDDCWIFGDDFGQSCRPSAEIARQLLEHSQMMAHVARDSDAVLGGFGQAQLQGAKWSSGTRNGQRHEAELPKDLLPSLERNPSLVAKLIEEIS